MKYVVIIVLVIILVRIDFIMQMFERASEKIQNQNITEPIDIVDSSSTLIPVAEDKNIKTSDKQGLFLLIEDFHQNPKKSYRDAVVDFLRNNPKLIGPKKDKDFELKLYSLLDLFQQGNEEILLLLADLLPLIQGENLEFIKKFASISFDTDAEKYLEKLPKTADQNCTILGFIYDNLDEMGKLEVFEQRSSEIVRIFALEKTNEEMKAYLNKCQTILKLQILKLKPAPVVEEAPVVSPIPIPESSPPPQP